MKRNLESDVRAVLPAIAAPTLVVHQEGDPVSSVRHGEYYAEHIPGAPMCRLPGDFHGSWRPSDVRSLIDQEPQLQQLLTELGLDAALEEVADFTDLRSPYRAGNELRRRAREGWPAAAGTHIERIYAKTGGRAGPPPPCSPCNTGSSTPSSRSIDRVNAKRPALEASVASRTQHCRRKLMTNKAVFSRRACSQSEGHCSPRPQATTPGSRPTPLAR